MYCTVPVFRCSSCITIISGPPANSQQAQPRTLQCNPLVAATARREPTRRPRSKSVSVEQQPRRYSRLCRCAVACQTLQRGKVCTNGARQGRQATPDPAPYTESRTHAKTCSFKQAPCNSTLPRAVPHRVDIECVPKRNLRNHSTHHNVGCQRRGSCRHHGRVADGEVDSGPGCDTRQGWSRPRSTQPLRLR